MTTDIITDSVSYHDNPAIAGREDKFTTCDVKVELVLASWRESLFAHEWLNSEGRVKSVTELSDSLAEKRKNIEKMLQGNKACPRPVLGIGILDNVEIGAAKDVFMILAALGEKNISVHIPTSQIKDFRVFIK